MTLKLTTEEKALRRKEYKHNYSRMYYQEQRDENSERYKDILEKARIRYEKKVAEKENDNNTEKKVRKYTRRNILNEVPIVVENEIA
jgi:hypothetical protein